MTSAPTPRPPRSAPDTPPVRPPLAPLALLALLVVLLVACTGTREARPPVLLAVGEGEAGGGAPRLLLLEDTFASVAAGSGATREIRALPWSARDLPGEPRALATSGAGASRDTLWVLTRDGEDAFALRFAFDDIDLDAESGFGEIAPGDRLRLDGPEGAPGLLDEAVDAGPDTYCLVELGVSLDGRYLALLDDRERCGLDDLDAIYIVDAQERELVASVREVEPDGGAGIAVDQDAGLLYHLDPFQLVVRDLDDGREVALLDPDALARPSDVRDLALTDAAVLLLRDGDYLVLPTDEEPGGDLAEGVTETLDDAARIVSEATLADRAITLAGSRFAYHRPLDDSDPFEGSSGSGAGAPATTLEPFEEFAYFVRPGLVVTLDLLRAETSSWRVDELVDPRVVTWGRALAIPTR